MGNFTTGNMFSKSRGAKIPNQNGQEHANTTKTDGTKGSKGAGLSSDEYAKVHNNINQPEREEQKPEENGSLQSVLDLSKSKAPGGYIRGVVVDPKVLESTMPSQSRTKEVPWNVVLGLRLVALTENLDREKFRSENMTRVKQDLVKGSIPPLANISMLKELAHAEREYSAEDYQTIMGDVN